MPHCIGCKACCCWKKSKKDSSDSNDEDDDTSSEEEKKLVAAKKEVSESVEFYILNSYTYIYLACGDYLYKKSWFVFMMGSNSRGKDGEGTSGINRVNDDDDDDSYEYLQEMNFFPYETLLHNNINTNGFVVPFVMQQIRDTWSFFHFLSISFILERFLW